MPTILCCLRHHQQTTTTHLLHTNDHESSFLKYILSKIALIALPRANNTTLATRQVKKKHSRLFSYLLVVGAATANRWAVRRAKRLEAFRNMLQSRTNKRLMLSKKKKAATLVSERGKDRQQQWFGCCRCSPCGCCCSASRSLRTTARSREPLAVSETYIRQTFRHAPHRMSRSSRMAAENTRFGSPRRSGCSSMNKEEDPVYFE